MERVVDTMCIETVNQRGENFYFVLNLFKEKIKSLYISPEFKQLCEKAQVVPTGNIYQTSYVLNNNPCWFSTLPDSSSLFLKTSEFDIISEQYFEFGEKVKLLEKELTSLLNSEPEHLKRGEQYGGFYGYTSSTNLAYAQLYDKLKQLVANKLGKVGESILQEMKTEEVKMSTPHKSSAKSLKVFRIGVNTEKEFSKMWRQE